MIFNNRRQSQDSMLREKIRSFVGNNKIFLNEYSAKQFENTDNLIISDDFLTRAKNDDFCFAENSHIPTDNIDEVYLFKWNRDYPADMYFTIDLKTGFKKVQTEDFVGTSHKKITLEIYKKRG